MTLPDGKEGGWSTSIHFPLRAFPLGFSAQPLLFMSPTQSMHTSWQQMAEVISHSGELNTDRCLGSRLFSPIKRKLVREMKEMDGSHAETHLQ